MKILRTVRNNKGLTLIELIIAIGIGVAVIISSYALLDYGFKSYANNAALIEEQQAIRNVALYISRDLHRADPGDVSITVTVDGYDLLTVGSTTYVLNGDTQQVLMDGYPMASGIAALDVSLSSGVVTYTITGDYSSKTVTSSVTLR